MHPDRFEALTRSLADSTSRRGMLRLIGAGVAGTAGTAIGLNEVLAQRNNRNAKSQQRRNNEGDSPFEDIAVTGVDAAGNEAFTGTLDVKRFVARGDQIYALGKLSGVVTLENGTEKRVTRGVSLPVELAASAPPEDEGGVSAQLVACGILDLTLGPLDLNLLGLRIQLSQIDLQITAIPGGGLLGDLLCAIADLLNPLGSLRQIVRLLNQLLALLG